MYSIFLLLLAAANLAVTLWVFWRWRQTGSGLILFVLLPLAAAPYETLVAGLGRYIGVGDQLRDLAGFPIFWWAFTLPLALFTFATLCRRLGFWWARIDWGHGLVCIGAVALLLWELPRVYGMKRIWAACWQDVVVYLPVVPPGQLCAGAGEPGESPAAVWLAPWIVFGAFAAAGIALWITRRWPWLALLAGGGLALLLIPATVAGPLPAILGRSLCLWGMAAAAVHYAHLRSPGAAAEAARPAGT